MSCDVTPEQHEQIRQKKNARRNRADRILPVDLRETRIAEKRLDAGMVIHLQDLIAELEGRDDSAARRARAYLTLAQDALDGGTI